jgi:hypothetical protein
VIQLSLALLFGPLYIVFDQLLPETKLPRALKPLPSWFRRNYDICLWTQLYVTFSISLVCFIREYKHPTPIYDSTVIQYIIYTSLTSLLLVMTAVHGLRQRRVSFFFVAMAITTVLGAAAALGPVFYPHMIDPVLEACILISPEEHLPWRVFGLRSYQLRGSVRRVMYWGIPIFVLFTVSTCRRFLPVRYVENSGKPFFHSGESFRLMKIGILKYLKQSPWNYRVFYLLIIAVSITPVLLSSLCIWRVTQIRKILKAAVDSSLGDDVWTVGQVLAVLAWLPLFVELIASIKEPTQPALKEETKDMFTV